MNHQQALQAHFAPSIEFALLKPEVSLMLRVSLLILALFLSSIGMGVPGGAALSAEHRIQLNHLDYLLALDRLDYYSEGLADQLATHNQEITAEAIREITPEDFAAEQFPRSELDNPEKWNELILTTLHKKSRTSGRVTLQDLTWNYNFFRKKLMEAFKSDPVVLKTDNSFKNLSLQAPQYSKRSVPQVAGQKILLDAERYIAEKTTRGLFWDAALTNKEIEFHLGTERDFRQVILKQERQVIAEIKTRSSNYNKIYLVFDPEANTYSYAFTRISGDDRIKHLIAQLRILKFNNKVAVKNNFVKVYGSAIQIHSEQEARLLEIFSKLPKADLVVIGQKSALSHVIANAGMMALVQPDITAFIGPDKSPVQKLSQRVNESGSYFSVTSKASIVTSEFEKLATPTTSRYEIFNSEQPSHDVSDVLFETTAGRIVRWRFISNMWGDEVIPVARALRKSGHQKVIYIGTAGAVVNKGLKVGDVVAPSKTYTQGGKLLDLEQPSYGKDFVKTGSTLGQVTSPFDETKKWFEHWNEKIDLVELETGYLREELGMDISFQPYLLVSDVVGSVHESLAVAGSDSSKRKNGQLKLLESLFIQNGIKAPLSVVEMITSKMAVESMFQKINRLRPSRDITSKLQLTQLALRQGLIQDDQLEALIKSEAAFTLQLLMDKLERFSTALEIISKKIANIQFAITGGDEFLNGTWNPKKILKLQLMTGNLSSLDAIKIYQSELEKIHALMGKELQIELINFNKELLHQSIPFTSGSSRVLIKHYDSSFLKPLGLNKEIDRNGGIRLRKIIETAGGPRCEALFL
jgi:hypothetical protein